MRRSTLATAGKYAFGFGLLAVVIWYCWKSPANSTGTGLEDVLQRPIQWGPLALAASICLISLFSFIRWYVLVRGLDMPFTVTNACLLWLIGYFWNAFLPGAVGGDFVMAYCISREQSR